MADGFASMFGPDCGCRCKDGGPVDHGGGTIPSCYCDPIPYVLAMASADPACNYRMFQSCTIRFGPAPPWTEPLNLGAEFYFSDEDFPDPLTGNEPDSPFYDDTQPEAPPSRFHYYLTCRYNEFSISRVYRESPLGSPYRDGILYTWLVGGSGNTCTPFRLDSGEAFQGSDASCFVTIDGP